MQWPSSPWARITQRIYRSGAESKASIGSLLEVERAPLPFITQSHWEEVKSEKCEAPHRSPNDRGGRPTRTPKRDGPPISQSAIHIWGHNCVLALSFEPGTCSGAFQQGGWRISWIRKGNWTRRTSTWSMQTRTNECTFQWLPQFPVSRSSKTTNQNAKYTGFLPREANGKYLGSPSQIKASKAKSKPLSQIKQKRSC